MRSTGRHVRLSWCRQETLGLELGKKLRSSTTDMAAAERSTSVKAQAIKRLKVTCAARDRPALLDTFGPPECANVPPRGAPATLTPIASFRFIPDVHVLMDRKMYHSCIHVVIGHMQHSCLTCARRPMAIWVIRLSVRCNVSILADGRPAPTAGSFMAL